MSGRPGVPGGAPGHRLAGLSPEELSALVERRRRTAAAPEASGPVRRRQKGSVPASFAQQRLWLLDRLQPGSPAYNMPFAYRLRGRLDRAALAAAWTAVVARHEALRTRFAETDGMPFQVIAAPLALPLPRIDLTALAAPAAERAALRIRRREALRRVDLARGPLAAARLLCIAPEVHDLVLNVHHAVFDGWSLGIVLRELAGFYCARTAGAEPPPPPALQYADFTLWQRRRLAGPALEELVAAWRRMLGSAPPPLDLPTDRPRPPRPGHRGAVVRATLPASLRERLAALAGSRRASLYMALLAGFMVVLARLAGQRDLVVGSPHAGRERSELEGIVGFFVNTLVMRTDLGDAPAFGSLVERVRETALEASAHQEVPFEKLVEELQPERDLSRPPLFSVFFNLTDHVSGTLELPGLEVETLRFERYGTKFDLTLYARTGSGGIELDLLYSEELFDAPRMEELLRQVRRFLEQAVERPELGIDRHDLLTDHARAVLPDPRQRLSAASRGTMPSILSRRALEVPDRTAVCDPTGVLSYGELEARSNRLAHRLRAAGARPGRVVAVWAFRDASLPVALFGVFKSGAAYAVLDPAYPGERVAELASLAGPVALVEAAGAPDPPPELLARLAPETERIRLPARGSAAEAGFLGAMSASPPAVPLGADDVALVAFTSGSTGRPKGVDGRHGALTHFLPVYAERFGLGEEDRFTVLSALSHDPLQRDLFFPVAFAATAVIPAPERMGEPGYLADWAGRERATVAALAPAMVALLAQGSSRLAAPLAPLRRAFVVGEVFTHGQAAALRSLAPHATCVNLYGTTETQRALAAWEVDPAWAGGGVLPLGRGLDGCQLLVLAAHGGLAGIGEPGELCIRSHHLARGYRDDPVLTAERFRPNPFLPETASRGDRLYRTGDFGRYLPDGGVAFIGRRDDQVQIRGFRVELGEVEAALAAHPEVAAAAVRMAPELPGGPGLVGYAVPAPGSEVTAGDLRRALAGRLPAALVPAAVVLLERLPLTPAGKVDRRSLPIPLRPGGPEGGRPPEGPVEEILAGLWSELLGREEVGAEEDFFALGGHSLLATQLLARVRDAFGVEVTLAELFEEPTVAALAQRLELLAGAALLPPVEPIAGRPGAPAQIPLSWGQQRLWVLDRLAGGGSAAYNLAGALRLDGGLVPAALGRACAGLVARHGALRTRIGSDADGRAYQVVDPAAEARPVVVDLCALPAGRRPGEGLRVCRGEGGRGFDLAADRLQRVLLIRMAADEHLLLLVLHHIVADAWSLGILVRDLATGYAAGLSGAAPELPEPPVTYADVVLWQQRCLEGEILDRQLAVWQRRLEGVPEVLEAPLDYPRPPQPSFRGGRERLSLPPETAAALARIARSRRATPFMVYLALFETLLARWSGQTAFAVGSPVANRRRQEVEEVVGLFANTLALVADLSGDPGFGELVDRTRGVTIEAFDHQDLPFERLVAGLEVERDLSRSPLFQVFFVLQNTPRAAAAWPGLEVTTLDLGGLKSPFDLTLQLVPTEGGGLDAYLEYARDLFEPVTARRLLERLAVLAAAVAERPGARLAELPVLSVEERRLLFETWQGPVRALPAATTLDALVSEQAARTPERIAVRYEEASVTYAWIEAAANRLARALRRRGVGPETLVGVSIERSAPMVAVLLGVLKAGGAYVPLDPAYPAERLQGMVADAGLGLIVTETLLAGRFGHFGGAAALLLVDGPEARGIEAESPAPLAPSAGAHNRAYVIYTSGSTGRPKGVEVVHGAVVNFLAAMARTPGLADGDVLLATTTLSFDIAVLELYLPLTVGARVVIAGRDVAADGAALAGRMAGVTAMQATPTTWRLLLESGWSGSDRLRVLSGGEALDGALAGRLAALTGELWNLYGPTETTVWSTVQRVVGPADGVVSVGRPIDNTLALVLDPALRPVPLGAIGELFLGGAGVARGYLGRPALTAERFVPDGSSGHPGGRLYRTGDLARWRNGGTVEFLGRCDLQVKVRGHRIEPGEIEAALAVHPAVAQAAVVAGEGSRLVAYLVAGSGATAPTVAALREHLGRSLPDYMIPARFVVLDALPRTPNGKVDRRSLPQPGDARTEQAALGSVHEEPESAAERHLADVWRQVLGVERVGRRDDFFALGGDSILAIQVVSRAAVLGLTLQPRHLFQHPTLAALAAQAQPVPAPAAPGRAPGTGPEAAPPPPAGGIDHVGLSADELAAVLAEIGG